MFKDETTLGVLVALLFISLCLGVVLFFTYKLISKDKILFSFIFIMTLLTSIWAVDKFIAFRISLLSEEENKAILQMINTMLSLIMGYYLKDNNNKNEQR